MISIQYDVAERKRFIRIELIALRNSQNESITQTNPRIWTHDKYEIAKLFQRNWK